MTNLSLPLSLLLLHLVHTLLHLKLLVFQDALRLDNPKPGGCSACCDGDGGSESQNTDEARRDRLNVDDNQPRLGTTARAGGSTKKTQKHNLPNATYSSSHGTRVHLPQKRNRYSPGIRRFSRPCDGSSRAHRFKPTKNTNTHYYHPSTYHTAVNC